jgi:hypothetical protein
MSDDGAGQVLRIDSQEKLEAWLKTQPREVRVAIAARAALRVLPSMALIFSGVVDYTEKSSPTWATTCSAVFRSVALAWVAASYPQQAFGLEAANAFSTAGRVAHIVEGLYFDFA